MNDRELYRVFAQVRPTPEQEIRMLEHLMREEAVSRPGRSLKKLPVIALAAVLLLLTCAFAAAGLDKRLLEYWNGGTEDEVWMADGVVQIDQSHTYENGWTITVRQAAADRYSLAVLVDITAPEGTVFKAEEYEPDFFLELSPRPKENGVSSSVSGAQWIEDRNQADNRASYVWYSGPLTSAGGMQSFPGCTVTLKPQSLFQWGVGSVMDLSADGVSWTFQMPDEDSGFTVPGKLEIQTDTRHITAEELYLSPVSLSLQLKGDVGGLDEDSFHLTLVNGEAVSMHYTSMVTGQESGNFVFRLGRMIDPAQVSSITILDQTVPIKPGTQDRAGQ